ncbi:MAG: GNAT family N-acetyltransferase [Tunicatimonas sp.]|uniref:GNAT family N-acetyltransferase n=1 Tax=Tunicatimonas sp. TaxID=1940096 RepID=UPI003C722DD6
MNIAEKTRKIILKPLEPKHVVAATHCISTTFTKGEPMSEALAISEEEFSYFAQLFIQKAAIDQLSVVAVTDTDEVVGALICEDYASPPPTGLEHVSEKFGPIAGLLETLGERFAQLHNVIPGSHLHMFMCGIYPQYARQQFAQRLISFAEDIARERGYKATVCEATGAVSQHMVKNSLGYTYVDEIIYQDFQYEEQAVFSTINTVKSCVAYYKAL